MIEDWIVENYHCTVEYVGYNTLPYLSGWSHYEVLSRFPEYHEHHSRQYQQHLEIRRKQKEEADHDG
jgi:hypothetical protein